MSAGQPPSASRAQSRSNLREGVHQARGGSHLGATPGHTGDIVVGAFSAGHTLVNLYVNADATPDAAIILNGDHSGLAAGDFVL